MLCTMKKILEPAMARHFAVPAFNTSSNMTLAGVMESCEQEQAPVIIEIHPDELSFVRDSFVKSIIDEAHRTSVPVCIHLDHGASFEQAVHAIACGFTSVMIDASSRPFEENIALTKKVVETAHAAGVSVEAELGTIGSTGNGEEGADSIIYTDPLKAEEFVEKTGVDTLAVAIGTRHGLYPASLKPELRLDLLKEIRSRVSVPLVLHGGSDNPDSEIAQAVQLGICKVNISSDIKSAFYRKCREVLRDESLREPNAIYPPCIAAMKEVVLHKIQLFQDQDKAKYYI